MLNIGEILKTAREDLDLRQTDVMKATGINNKNLSGYENGVAEPDLETVGILFKFYGLSVDAFLGLSPEKPKYTADEKRLVRLYRSLAAPRKEQMLDIMHAVVDFDRRKP